MKKSELLRKAKVQLAWKRGQSPLTIHICNAVIAAVRLEVLQGRPLIFQEDAIKISKSPESAVGYAIKQDIAELLLGHDTYEEWLIDKYGLSWDILNQDVEKVQRSRHAWVDAMIAHYEAQGN